jgi:hypothetical protein
MADSLPVIPDHTPRPTILEKLHWRDLRIPGDIFTLLLDNSISSTEILLLAIIDGGVRVRGEGCWITNKEFANALGIKHEFSIRRMIRHLKDLGLVKQVGWKMYHGQRCRLLETSWSRVFTRENINVRSESTFMFPYSTNVEIRQTVEDQESSTKREKPPVINEEMAVPLNAPNGQLFHENQISPTAVKKKGKTLPFDNRCATYLRKSVVAKTNTNGKWKHSKWANEFRMLRESVNDNRVRVDNVLEWYAEHIGSGPFVPVAHCAKTFRDKFLKIEAQMEKDYAKSPTDVVVSSEATDLTKRLKFLRWPKTSGQNLDKAVQVTLSSFRSFRQKLAIYVKNNAELIQAGGSYQRAPGKVQLAHIVARSFNYPVMWVEKWFTAVHARIAKWDNWSDDIMREAWHGDLKDVRFANSITADLVAQGYQSYLKYWDELTKELA